MLYTPQSSNTCQLLEKEEKKEQIKKAACRYLVWFWRNFEL